MSKVCSNPEHHSFEIWQTFCINHALNRKIIYLTKFTDFKESLKFTWNEETGNEKYIFVSIYCLSSSYLE